MWPRDLEEGHSGEVGQPRAPTGEFETLRDDRDVDGLLELSVCVKRFGGHLVRRSNQNPVYVELVAKSRKVTDVSDGAGLSHVAAHDVWINDPADQRHAGILSNAQKDSIHDLSRPHHDHPGGRQGVQEIPHGHSTNADDDHRADDREDQLRRVGLSDSNDHMKQRSRGDCKDATRSNPETQFTHFQERAGL